jgi:hypothetical protein
VDQNQRFYKATEISIRALLGFAQIPAVLAFLAASSRFKLVLWMDEWLAVNRSRPPRPILSDDTKQGTAAALLTASSKGTTAVQYYKAEPIPSHTHVIFALIPARCASPFVRASLLVRSVRSLIIRYRGACFFCI